MLSKRLFSTGLVQRKALKRSLLSTNRKKLFNAQPTSPARTRFAPSPTGFLHLGSLRTALYNYLLAKSTGGEFLLRLEDTDQKRLVDGAEQNIYDSLEWCGLNWDEGPIVGGPYGPYRQSDRTDIYKGHIQTLLDSGNAYRCFCSKERLDSLRESAQKLHPPTTASYDRNCSHISKDESDQRALADESFTIRFRSPSRYPPFEDLLHGQLDLQPQINRDDVRYDDQVLVKSDGLPTYHFANVIDDHLMNITHVIRGEEWLPSTPKHIALYNAFGWKSPHFIHIPLLTSTKDKKLSKRSGDIDVTTFKKNGILPEALVNFVSLFGWSPPKEESTSEIYKLDELVKLFNLNSLTKGNAKVDDKKLSFFNKHYLSDRIRNDDEEIISDALNLLKASHLDVTREKVQQLLKYISHSLTTIGDVLQYDNLLTSIDLTTEASRSFIETTDKSQSIEILQSFKNIESIEELDTIVSDLASKDFKKKHIFQTLRFALSGGKSGLKIPLLVEFIGFNEANDRINKAIAILENSF